MSVKVNQNLKLLGCAQFCSGSEGVKYRRTSIPVDDRLVTSSNGQSSEIAPANKGKKDTRQDARQQQNQTHYQHAKKDRKH